MGNSKTEERNFKNSIMKIKMIASMLMLVAFFTATSSFAQTKPDSLMMKDCCMMKDGKMMMMKNGAMTPMEENVSMKNGTQCMTNGECVTKEGKTIRMQEGECMDMDGNKDNCDMMHMQKRVGNDMKSDPTMKTAYVCSMHPEITGDGPGKCSKCGMDMNKVK